MASTSCTTSYSPSAIITAILKVTHERIIPLTRESFAKGDDTFGAALDRDSHLEPVAVAVNAGHECLIYHGEANCIIKYSEIPPERRPVPERCIFFATHEPCSLCLSAFAWTGFRVIYFLFTYEGIHRLLRITDDVEIIREVFQVPESESNKFFSVYSMHDLLEEVEDIQKRSELQKKVDALRMAYDEFRPITEGGSI
ncbi:hypothetical protein F5Y09DRAFT_338624 [Xylaria sp. FL1042]|nr:hypothetical protein F5Y09DRAFT_338624 [Xylaria sp. FL1042]